MAGKPEFKKGDASTHYFEIPASLWSAGGTLFFAAKPVPDADGTDANAVINKSFNDSVVSDVTIDGVAQKRYTLAFVAADTNSISFADGSKKKKYLGEFQFVPILEHPLPSDDKYLDVVVYADLKRATS